MVALDRWIVHRAWELQEKIKAAYDGYNMAEIVQLLLNFCSVDLGSLYLDVTKDRLYTMPTDSHGRRSAQSAMYHIAEAFTRWVAPILTFTADELWGYLPGEHAGHVLFTTWYDGLAPLPAMPSSTPPTSTSCWPCASRWPGARADACQRRDRCRAGSGDHHRRQRRAGREVAAAGR
jgi:isoleucyl-tRNA synthetase